MMAEARQTVLPPGYALEHFHIAEVLGQGGFGITYKAMDTWLQRIVAIKEYLPRQFACRGDDSTVMPCDDKDRETFAWELKRFINAYGHDDVTLYALLGEKERALSNLEEVAGTGYLTNWHALEYATQYVSIRDDSRFDQAMTVLRSKAHDDREQAKSEGLLDSP